MFGSCRTCVGTVRDGDWYVASVMGVRWLKRYNNKRKHIKKGCSKSMSFDTDLYDVLRCTEEISSMPNDPHDNVCDNAHEVTSHRGRPGATGAPGFKPGGAPNDTSFFPKKNKIVFPARMVLAFR